LAAISWLLFAFVMTAGYAGNLRAYLMTPDVEEPIETLADVFASGFKWDMFEYGGITNIVASSPEDEQLNKFWRGKEKVKFSSYLYDRVGKNIDFKIPSLYLH